MKILDDLRRARATAESLERIVADFVRLVPGNVDVDVVWPKEDSQWL